MADVGDAPTLACSVSATPAGTITTYQWKRPDMTEISGATSATYQVSSSVGVSDAGVYTCEATVSVSGSSPHIISGISSVDIILTVISK